MSARVRLSVRDRAVLAYLSTRPGGALVYDISRAVPGGRSPATLTSLERRGLVKVNRRNPIYDRGQKITGAYLTPDGIEAFLLSQPGLSHV